MQRHQEQQNAPASAEDRLKIKAQLHAKPLHNPACVCLHFFSYKSIKNLKLHLLFDRKVTLVIVNSTHLRIEQKP
jgi:hypothetical protein